MYCSNCGEKHHVKPNFCAHCGFDLRDVEAKTEEPEKTQEEVTEEVSVENKEISNEAVNEKVEVVKEEKVEELKNEKSKKMSFFKYNPNKKEMTKGDHILKILTYILSISIILALVIMYFAIPENTRQFDLRVGDDVIISSSKYELVGSDNHTLKHDGSIFYRLASNQKFGETNYDVVLEKIIGERFVVVMNENVHVNPNHSLHIQEILVFEPGDYRLSITMGGQLVGLDHFSIR